MSLSYEEKLALLKINSFSYLRADWLERLLGIFGSAQEILKQNAAALSEEGKISLQTAEHFLKAASALYAEREMERTQKTGGGIVFKGHEGYPEVLLDIKEPPLALYIRGKLGENAATVAMVGTRKITPYGKRAAARLAEDLALSGITLVSGLARGVDSIVHSAAVKNCKPTWALIGTGIGRIYPPENRELALGILDKGGAIISELPYDAPPLAAHFPRRNRLIAGLSKLVVVVEGEEKSGALITAKMALEQGLDVLAVPGPIDSPQSCGTNRLIREGAAMVMDARDIIDALPVNLKAALDTDKLYAATDKPAKLIDLNEQETKIMAAIGDGSKSVDNIALETGFDIAGLSGLLFNMEINNIIYCKDGLYARNKF
ncbi:MAG: DNA-processing protein DprA [Elusimicrobiota bacterium]|jgi:DNA processing protein|nr:DNA-processing protein DprA [Elusimicrobiota bacterium]